MRIGKLSTLNLLGRFFMASLFVGTIWMGSAGCEVDEHGDHAHHDDHMDHSHDHDHDHDRDWH